MVIYTIKFMSESKCKFTIGLDSYSVWTNRGCLQTQYRDCTQSQVTYPPLSYFPTPQTSNPALAIKVA